MSKIITDINEAIAELQIFADKYCPGARFVKTIADDYYDDERNRLVIEDIHFYDETMLELEPNDEDARYEARNLPLRLLTNTYDVVLGEPLNGLDSHVTISVKELELLLEAAQSEG